MPKLRQVEELKRQGGSTAEAVRKIGAMIQACYQWGKEIGGMSRDQSKRIKVLKT